MSIVIVIEIIIGIVLLVGGARFAITYATWRRDASLQQLDATEAAGEEPPHSSDEPVHSNEPPHSSDEPVHSDEPETQKQPSEVADRA